MSKKTGPRRQATARGERATAKDLTTPKRSSVERGEVTGGGKRFMIFVSGPDGPVSGKA